MLLLAGHRRNQSNFSETSESSSENHSSELDKLIKVTTLFVTYCYHKYLCCLYPN